MEITVLLQSEQLLQVIFRKILYMGGVPARFIETLDEYINKHKDDFDYTKYPNAESKKLSLLKNIK